MNSYLPTFAVVTTDIPAWWYLTLGLFMFTMGGIGVVVRRNPVVVFMCIELMLNAANLTFLTFAKYNFAFAANSDFALNGNTTTSAMNGQMMVIFIMAVAAAPPAIAPRSSRT